MARKPLPMRPGTVSLCPRFASLDFDANLGIFLPFLCCQQSQVIACKSLIVLL
jgi:hypothetical protein